MLTPKEFIFPLNPPKEVVTPETNTFPRTSRVAKGFVVPIPTRPIFVVETIVPPVPTFKILTVAIPVILPFLAVNSSNTKSSATYKSPPTYKSLTVVVTPVNVDTPVTINVCSLVFPTTSNFVLGFAVPIPIFGSAVVAIPTFLLASLTLTNEANCDNSLLLAIFHLLDVTSYYSIYQLVIELVAILIVLFLYVGVNTNLALEPEISALKLPRISLFAMVANSI